MMINQILTNGLQLHNLNFIVYLINLGLTKSSKLTKFDHSKIKNLEKNFDLEATM